MTPPEGDKEDQEPTEGWNTRTKAKVKQLRGKGGDRTTITVQGPWSTFV